MTFFLEIYPVSGFSKKIIFQTFKYFFDKIFGVNLFTFCKFIKFTDFLIDRIFLYYQKLLVFFIRDYPLFFNLYISVFLITFLFQIFFHFLFFAHEEVRKDLSLVLILTLFMGWKTPAYNFRLAKQHSKLMAFILINNFLSFKRIFLKTFGK